MNDTRLEEIKQVKEETQTLLKGKAFNTLSTKEKDTLLETLAKMFGLIE
jgi:hypothetical protein